MGPEYPHSSFLPELARQEALSSPSHNSTIDRPGLGRIDSLARSCWTSVAVRLRDGTACRREPQIGMNTDKPEPEFGFDQFNLDRCRLRPFLQL